MRNTGNLKKWNSFLKSCAARFPAHIKFLSDSDLSRDQVIKSLNSTAGAQGIYRKITYYEKKRESEYDREFEQELEDLLEIGDKQLNVESYKWKRQKNCNDYLNCLFQLAYAINIENIAMVDDVLKRLIKIPSWFLVEEVVHRIPYEHRKRFSNTFVRMLKRLKDLDSDKNLKQMYFDNLSSIEEVANLDLGESAIQEIFTSSLQFDLSDYKYVLSYPTYWLEQIDENEKIQLAVKFYSTPLARNINILDANILNYKLPQKQKILDRFVKAQFSRFDTSNTYEVSTILKLLDNSVIKKEAAKINESFDKPVFIVKRDILKKNFEKTLSFYSLLELLKIGDQDKELLWWFL
jgi:hypothetical protein